MKKPNGTYKFRHPELRSREGLRLVTARRQIAAAVRSLARQVAPTADRATLVVLYKDSLQDSSVIIVSDLVGGRPPTKSLRPYLRVAGFVRAMFPDNRSVGVVFHQDGKKLKAVQIL